MDSTHVLDEIFDPAKGWPFSAAEVPLQRTETPDGPQYLATVDGVPIRVFEQSRWKEGVSRKTSPRRLGALTAIGDVNITNPNALLTACFDTLGLPSFGLDPQGNPTLHAAFPYEAEIPLDVARKQLMVCMGLLSEQSRELIQAWNSASSTWQVAEGVASVAGAFLRAFSGSSHRVDPESGVVQEKGIFGWKDTDTRVEPGSGDIQERGIFGWQDTDKRIDPQSGVVQERGLLGYHDTDTRIDPETGVIQERGIFGWQDSDERIDPVTGKHQVRGIFGWKDK
jgi:hypothetical protein